MRNLLLSFVEVEIGTKMRSTINKIELNKRKPDQKCTKKKTVDEFVESESKKECVPRMNAVQVKEGKTRVVLIYVLIPKASRKI